MGQLQEKRATKCHTSGTTLEFINLHNGKTKIYLYSALTPTALHDPTVTQLDIKKLVSTLTAKSEAGYSLALLFVAVARSY